MNVLKERSGTCYSDTYMSQTSDQKHFTISEVAADWHELICRDVTRLGFGGGGLSPLNDAAAPLNADGIP